jgi:protein-tyrosine phosphatase
MAEPRRVLFVCLGNICRSPTAEGVFRHLVEEARLASAFEIDSAGTGAWHVGEPPDRRMTQAAAAAGYRLEGAARQVRSADFEYFHDILAMDSSNLRDLRAFAPDGLAAKIRLFRELDPHGAGEDVPDPYYGGDDGFRQVVNIVERTARAWLEALGPKGAP